MRICQERLRSKGESYGIPTSSIATAGISVARVICLRPKESVQHGTAASKGAEQYIVSAIKFSKKDFHTTPAELLVLQFIDCLTSKDKESKSLRTFLLRLYSFRLAISGYSKFYSIAKVDCGIIYPW